MEKFHRLPFAIQRSHNGPHRLARSESIGSESIHQEMASREFFPGGRGFSLSGGPPKRGIILLATITTRTQGTSKTWNETPKPGA